MRRRWIYTGACLTVLLALFLNWLINTPPAGLPAVLSSIIITALFALLGIRFIPRWMEAWSGAENSPVPSERSEHGTFVRIFFALILTRVAVIGFSYILDFAVTGGGDFYSRLYSVWTSGDGAHYLDIAERWYQSSGSRDEVVLLVFLPLYPILTRIAAILFRNYFISAMLVSQLSFAFAGTVLYKLARLDMGREDALRTVKYLVILPSAFFFSAPMSDALFLLLSVSCVYCARKKRYLLACVLGGFAAFTRSLGLTLLAPVCFELAADIIREAKTGIGIKKYSKYLPALLIIPLGFALYLYINYLVSGNPFQYSIYEKEHWSQSLGYFWNTAAYQLQHALGNIKSGELWKFSGLWLPNLVFIFGSLAAMAATVRRIRPSYTAYFIAYYVIGIGATWLLSGPRYLAALFPLSFAFSSFTRKRTADDLLTAAFLIGTALYMFAFVSHWQVY